MGCGSFIMVLRQRREAKCVASGYTLLPTLIAISIIYVLVGQLMQREKLQGQVVETVYTMQNVAPLTMTMPSHVVDLMGVTLEAYETQIQHEVSRYLRTEPVDILGNRLVPDETMQLLTHAVAYKLLVEHYTEEGEWSRKFDFDAMPRYSMTYDTTEEADTVYWIDTTMTVYETSDGSSSAEHKEMRRLSSYEEVEEALGWIEDRVDKVEQERLVNPEVPSALSETYVQGKLAILKNQLADKNQVMLYTKAQVREDDAVKVPGQVTRVFNRTETYTAVRLEPSPILSTAYLTEPMPTGERFVSLRLAYQKEE